MCGRRSRRCEQGVDGRPARLGGERAGGHPEDRHLRHHRIVDGIDVVEREVQVGRLGLPVEDDLRVVGRVRARRRPAASAASGSVPTKRVSTRERSRPAPSARSRRTASSPTLVSTAARWPRRAAATATLVAVPPDRLAERADFPERDPQLLGVEIDADAPDGQELQAHSSRLCELVLELAQLGPAGHQAGQLRPGRSPPWRSCRATGRG